MTLHRSPGSLWLAPMLTMLCAQSTCIRLLPSNFHTHKDDPRATPVAHPPGDVVRSEPLPGFMKGLNIGNALDAPREGEWGVHLRRGHFAMAAEAGFDHVRLPVRFSAHAADDPPYALDDDFMERVDWAINQATSHHLGIIVDLHHYNELMKNADHDRERFVALWRQIAARYRDRPSSVAFELLNEPNGKLEPSQLNPLMREALRAVRETNPNRVVLVDSYNWANAEYLSALDLPTDDRQVVATFHCYAPMLFTHQGSHWMDAEYKTDGVVFPGPPTKPLIPVPAAQAKNWTRDWFRAYNAPLAPGDLPPSVKDVLKTFDQAGEFVQKTKLRVYLGEFAAIDNADLPSRERYTRFVREEAERRGMGWAYWDDGGTMKMMNVVEGEFLEPLRDALFLPAK